MANMRKVLSAISGMFSRNQSNSNGLDSRDPPIVPKFDYDADVKEHSQSEEDYKKHGSQPVEAESEPKDHIYNTRYFKKIKDAKETMQKVIKLTHDSQIIPFEYSKSSAWPDFVASLEQQIYDTIDSIARTDPLIASQRDSIACDIILDAINDFVKSNYMTQELKNQFYDRVIDEVDKDKMIQAGANSLVSGEKAFKECAYIKLFVSMINKCRSDYRLLHLFCKHRNILERNIRRQIDEKSKTSKFIFYGLINDYININGSFTTNDTVDEMEKFVKSLYNMFVNTIILHSLTRKQGLSKDRITFIERRFFDYRDTFESETGIDIFAQEIANLEKDKRIPKVDYVSLQFNGDLVIKTLQFILKNPGIRNDLEPDLAILQNEHVSDIVDFLGFKENSEVFKTCGLSHNVMKNPVKLSNNHICYDYASIIQAWVEEQKLQKEMSYTFMEPYARIKCDIRDFIFDKLEIKRTKIFFSRGGSFSKLFENYNVFMSVDYKGKKFEEILKDVCDKRITDKAHKDAVLKKFVGDQTLQSEITH